MMPTRTAARARFVVLFAALLFSAPLATAQEREVLQDFERADVVEQFITMQTVRVERDPVADGAPLGGPSGFALRADTAGNAGIFSKKGAAPKELLGASDIEFWIYRPASAKATSTVELQFLEGDGRTKFWSKLELTHAGWKRYRLPLRWFRWGDGRIPRWDRIDRWGVWFRDAADVQFDNVAVLRSDDQDIALPQTEDYATTAFPGRRPADVKIHDREGLRILTDAPALNLALLSKHLAKVQQQVEADMGKRQANPWPATIIIHETRDGYAAFLPRLAERYQARIEPPRSAGFTTLGVATSYWDAKQGALRPVYTHEFVHSVLSRTTGLPNRGEWLQEGLASLYQLRFHPQPDLNKIVRQGISDPGHHEPLNRLTNGERISMNRYWQAATFCELLLTHDKYKSNFPALIAALAERGDTNLEAVRKDLLGVSWEELTADWKKNCAARYRD